VLFWKLPLFAVPFPCQLFGCELFVARCANIQKLVVCVVGAELLIDSAEFLRHSRLRKLSQWLAKLSCSVSYQVARLHRTAALHEIAERRAWAERSRLIRRRGTVASETAEWIVKRGAIKS
jgi:hypothetical protein